MSGKVQTFQPRPYIATSISNEWSTGICDCFTDLPSCCFAFWCFPCFSCITAKKAGECLCLPLLDAFGFIPPITTAMRVSIRHRYGIQVRLDTINRRLLEQFCLCSRLSDFQSAIKSFLGIKTQSVLEPSHKPFQVLSRTISTVSLSQGDICHDCVYSCFCGPCTWCQISREMEIRKAPMIYAA
uniref:Plac8 onzin related protein 5 n=1 Tax=Oryzias melastigma TaxID=30732 RepID=A0A3B3D0I5_ORYME